MCHFPEEAPMTQTVEANEVCPICLDALSITGEHQICSLSCGHLCGHSCLKEWFEKEIFNKSCPKCRKSVDSEQTVLLQWDGRSPIDTSHADNVKQFNENLQKQIGKLKSDLQKAQTEYIILGRRYEKYRESKTPIRKYEKRPITRPSLIFEHVLTNGSRVCSSAKNTVFTLQQGANFGIKNVEYETMNTSNFIQLHTQQIRDMAASPLDGNIIGTVSTDCNYIETSIRTGQIVKRAALPVPLWSCTFMNSNSVMVGGTGGQVFVLDGSGSITSSASIGQGPPISSLIRLGDNNILAVTPLKSCIYETRMGTFSNTFAGFTGGRFENGIITTLSRKGKEATFSVQKYSNGKIYGVASLPINKYETMARPSAVPWKVPNSSLIAIPDGDVIQMREFGRSGLSSNLWPNRFKKRGGPITDISMSIGRDLYISTVSADLLRIYAIPP